MEKLKEMYEEDKNKNKSRTEEEKTTFFGEFWET